MSRSVEFIAAYRMMQAVGWAQLFMSKASTRDMCAVLWTLISQQAAREGPPHFLLSGAPREHRVFSPVHRVRYLLRLSQIRTLYWISDEADRYQSPSSAPASCTHLLVTGLC